MCVSAWNEPPPPPKELKSIQTHEIFLIEAQCLVCSRDNTPIRFHAAHFVTFQHLF